ncbi:MAG: EamA family transporter [Victivallales bacterium]|nr:EamA family transporter [Victivallales bacterium]
MALLFALTSCFCAAVNDVIFHHYAQRLRSRGAYILIIGTVWTFLFAVFMDFKLFFSWNTLFWGILSGVFSAMSNILLIEGMLHSDVGKCSTVYHLNLVFVVLGAFLFLGEAVTFIKLAGILFALLAVFLFFSDAPHTRQRGRIVRSGLYLVGGAALLRAATGLSYKYALDAGIDRNALLALNGMVWMVSGGFYILFKERASYVKFSFRNFTYGVISALLICGAVHFLILSLRRGEASIILPLAQMSFIFTSLFGVLIFREKLSRRKILGILAGTVCILCMGKAL